MNNFSAHSSINIEEIFKGLIFLAKNQPFGFFFQFEVAFIGGRQNTVMYFVQYFGWSSSSSVLTVIQFSKSFVAFLKVMGDTIILSPCNSSKYTVCGRLISGPMAQIAPTPVIITLRTLRQSMKLATMTSRILYGDSMSMAFLAMDSVHAIAVSGAAGPTGTSDSP